MGWLIAFGAAIMLALLPLGISGRYGADGPLVKILIGPIRFTVFPRPHKEKKGKKKEALPETTEREKKGPPLPQPPQPPGEEKAKAEPKEKGGSVADFLPLVKVALDFLGDFRRKLRVDRLEWKLIMAGGDPCDLAVNYGRAWAALGNLIPQLERLFVIKKRDMEVECDFTASETVVIARLDMTMTLGRLLALAVRYGFRAGKEFLSVKKKRKGGAVI